MKIGILTFHWGTNYGAILQAYCLQEYLIEQGYDVSIINYKPKQYDFSWLRIVKNPKSLIRISRILSNRRKEALLEPFRNHYLKTTCRYYCENDIKNDLDDFDIIISGSDQVLNPSFTMYGDNGSPSNVYWLGVGSKEIKRLCYAVSFGCESYPNNAAVIAKQCINKIDAIGVREQTGLHILEQLDYKGPKVVLPDPTLLLGIKIFEKLGIDTRTNKSNYTCVYMLRYEIEITGDVYYIDEKHSPLTLEQWLTTIINAGKLITNSYHGMIMALLAHVPFVVFFEKKCSMNDRFYTLLSQLGIENRTATTIEEAQQILDQPIAFDEIDNAIEKYRMVGVNFLKQGIDYEYTTN